LLNNTIVLILYWFVLLLLRLVGSTLEAMCDPYSFQGTPSQRNMISTGIFDLNNQSVLTYIWSQILTQTQIQLHMIICVRESNEIHIKHEPTTQANNCLTYLRSWLHHSVRHTCFFMENIHHSQIYSKFNKVVEEILKLASQIDIVLFFLVTYIFFFFQKYVLKYWY
jgi:hypothetical protein